MREDEGNLFMGLFWGDCSAFHFGLRCLDG